MRKLLYGTAGWLCLVFGSACMYFSLYKPAIFWFVVGAVFFIAELVSGPDKDPEGRA